MNSIINSAPFKSILKFHLEIALELAVIFVTEIQA